MSTVAEAVRSLLQERPRHCETEGCTTRPTGDHPIADASGGLRWVYADCCPRCEP